MKLFAVLVLLFCADRAFGQDIKCPDEASKVDFTSSFSGKRRVFCQVNQDGDLVKHGPFVLYSENGNKLEEREYKFGKKVSGSTSAPVENSVERPEKTVEDTSRKEKLDQITDKILLDILRIHPEKELLIHKSKNGRCEHSSLKRLKFLVAEESYAQEFKFDDRCHFQGEVRYQFGQSTDISLKAKNLEGFDKISGDLLLTKKSKKNGFDITTKISEGKLVNQDGDQSLKFVLHSDVGINKSKAVKSQGRKGIELKTVFVKVVEFNGESINYTKEI